MTIGATAPHRRQQVVLSSSSDDEELVAPPSLRVVAPLPAETASAETHGQRRAWEATATMPESTRATPAVIALVAAATLETAWVTPIAAGRAATIVPGSARVAPGELLEPPGGSTTG